LLAEQNNRAARISAGQNIPTVDEAEASYVAAGGHLSPVAHFGSDPLADSPELIQQQQNIPTLIQKNCLLLLLMVTMPLLHSPCSS